MAKVKKQPRPKAVTPRGFKDDFGATVRRRNEMLAALGDLYHLHGFEALDSSAVETVEALGKFLPDVDRPNEGVFAWNDEAEGWLALRYDLTAPLARVAAQYRNDLPNPYRRYAIGPVWRNEKPGPGRFRQFYQCDADTVGSANIAADAEMVALMAQALERAGIDRTDFAVKVNNRKVLNGVMQAAGLYDPQNPDADADHRGIVLRTVDKFDRFGEAGVRALLGEGRLDDSGDFTKGAGLASEQIDRVLAFVGATRATNRETLDVLSDLVAASELGKKGVEELSEISALVDAQGFDERNIKVDPSVVRGLGYYTGPVMEAELTFEVRDEKGRVRQFGSVAGGGRYDDLVKRFTGQEVPAVGISIGVDRLMAALAMRGQFKDEYDGPVIVTVMERDRVADYQRIVDTLRTANIRAELYVGNPKNFGNQLKYADERRSRFAVIQGSEEREKNTVQVKDLVLGARLAEEIANREEWANQPAQETIPTADLVTYLRGRLTRELP